MWHSDVWRLSPVISIKGSRYFLIFSDDLTRYSWIFFFILPMGLYRWSLKSESNPTPVDINFQIITKDFHFPRYKASHSSSMPQNLAGRVRNWGAPNRPPLTSSQSFSFCQQSVSFIRYCALFNCSFRCNMVWCLPLNTSFTASTLLLRVEPMGNCEDS